MKNHASLAFKNMSSLQTFRTPFRENLTVHQFILPGHPKKSAKFLGIFIQPKAPGMKPRAARGTISMSFVSPPRS